MKKTIEKQENLDLRQGIAEELIVEDGVCKGVITNQVPSIVQKQLF